MLRVIYRVVAEDLLRHRRQGRECYNSTNILITFCFRSFQNSPLAVTLVKTARYLESPEARQALVCISSTAHAL